MQDAALALAGEMGSAVSSSDDDSVDEADGAPPEDGAEAATSDSDNENPPLRGSMLVPAKPLMQGRPTMPSAPASCSLDQPALRAPTDTEAAEGAEAARGPGDFPDLPEHWPPPALHGDYVVYMFEGPAADMLPAVAAPPSSLLPLALPAESVPVAQPLLPPPPPRDAHEASGPGRTAGDAGRAAPGDVPRVREAPSRPGLQRQSPPGETSGRPPDSGGWLRTTPPLFLTRRRPPDVQASPPPGASFAAAPADALASRSATAGPDAPRVRTPDSPQGPTAAPGASLTVQPLRRDTVTVQQPAAQTPPDASSARTVPAEAPAKKAPKAPDEGKAAGAEPKRKRPVGVAAEGLIHPFHIALFAVLLLCCLVAGIMLMHYTTEMGWMWSGIKVLRKLAKGLAFRQTVGLLSAMAFVRWGLEPLVRTVRALFRLPGDWERSSEFFFLRQVRPHLFMACLL